MNMLYIKIRKWSFFVMLLIQLKIWLHIIFLCKYTQEGKKSKPLLLAGCS